MSDRPIARASARADLVYEAPESAAHWDEVLDPSGRPRPHWRRLVSTLQRMGVAEFSRRWDAGRRLLQVNGVAYNIYGDPRGAARPWPMDLVPLAIDASEWAGIERAVVQRATLLNAILADLYGSRQLVYDGFLPPELVFPNPGFLRPCCGVRPSQGVYLQNYAVDIARSPNGAWWAISDRTQAPSGSGYALENRLVSARTLPAVLDRCRVRPLHDFFDRTVKALLALAPRLPDNPRVVVLTAGPNSETYFEHSFFARQWDFPLVVGDDLTVRNGCVYLKTLAGLNPVDVIVRRLDDAFCDPLELRGDSLLGVPGLLQAVRAGTVFIANGLGSGAVETPAMMAFLPGLCRHLLGEDLLMPSVATWWCGQDAPRRQVLDRLDTVVVKPVFPRFGHRIEFPSSMSLDARRELAARIEASPADFVAQEQVNLSTTAVHTHRGLEPRHVVLRVLAAWDGQSYAVLPGGLTRVGTEAQSLVVSMQHGGGSKDTWVVGPRASAAPVPALPRPQSTHVTATELSSRVADNLFWLGRYAERLEANARLIRVLLANLSTEADYDRQEVVATTQHYLRGLNLLPPGPDQSAVTRQWWRVQRYLTDMVFDESQQAGVAWYLRHLRRLSWEVKERLSGDTWRVLQQLEEAFLDAPPSSHERRLVAAQGRLDHVVLMLSAFAGLLAEHPMRGHGWRFLAIGRRLERAIQMIELLRVGVARAPYPDDASLEVLLHVADSATSYRSRYLASFRTRYVLELLLVDEANPRSVAFQALALRDRVQGLPARPPDDGTPAPEVEAVSRLCAAIGPALIDDLVRRAAGGGRPRLEAHLTALNLLVADVSETITARYLSHAAPLPLRT